MSEFGYLFDDDLEINSTQKIKGRSIVSQNKHEMKLLKREDELAKVFTGVEKNTTVHLLSSDNFGSIELLKHICKTESPEEIKITTWSYNQDFVNFIKEQCEISRISICVDKSMKKRKSALYNQLAELSIDKKITLKMHYMIHS